MRINEKTVLSSLAYKFTERLAVKGIGLIISIVLARLLDPHVFGLLAILTVFIDLSTTFVQGGLNTALIQNRTADERDYSTVFYISLLIALIMTAVIYISAPFIAKYYGDSQLTVPLRVYSVSLIFGAFNSVQNARVTREMKFKQMMFCSLIATILSGIIGVYMAYRGYGLWALVVYNLSQTVVFCITLLIADKWFPKLMFSAARAKELCKYGWKMLVSSILCSIYADIRTLIIGKKFSTEDLAYYNRGEQFPGVIAGTLDTAIQSVMFPVLSAAQDSKALLRSILKRSVAIGVTVIFPTMMGLAAVSQPLVRVLLTDKWIDCVPYFQIICFAQASIPFSSSNLIAIKATGRSDVYMKLELIRRIIMMIILLISVLCFANVMSIAVGFTICAWIDVIVIIIAECRLVGYSLPEQLNDTWRSICAAVLMAIAIYFLNYLRLPSQLLILVIQIITGVVLYVGISLLLKDTNILHIINDVKSVLKSVSKRHQNIQHRTEAKANENQQK